MIALDNTKLTVIKLVMWLGMISFELPVVCALCMLAAVWRIVRRLIFWDSQAIPNPQFNARTIVAWRGRMRC